MATYGNAQAFSPNSKTTPNPNGINYISGSGKYKHTNNANDPECTTNWNYYARDGKTLILGNIPSITMQGDNKNWCALKDKPPPFTVGLKYNTVNKNTDGILSNVQTFIFLIQEIGCKELIPRIINNIQTSPVDSRKVSSQEAINMLTINMGQMVKNMDISVDSKQKLIVKFNELVENIVNQISTGGIVDVVKLKLNLFN